MPPFVRKLTLTVHLVTSVGWMGAVLAYLALGVMAATGDDPARLRAAWTAMEVTGWWACVPLALGSLVSGVVISLGTPWGLFRHYWVLISLALTAIATLVLVLHMPGVSHHAALAARADLPTLRTFGSDLFHPSVGFLVLLAVTVLNVFKPRGLTPYGWRKLQEERSLSGHQAPAPSQRLAPLSRSEER